MSKSIESLAEAYKVSITLTKTAKGKYQWEVKSRDNDLGIAEHTLIAANDELILRYGSPEDEMFHSTIRGKEKK